MKSRIIKYSRGQQVILVVLVCFILISVIFDLYIRNSTCHNDSFIPDSTLISKISDFENSLETIQWNYKKSWNFKESKIYIPHERFAFDPNTVDSTSLIRLGFQPYMAKNLLNFRRHGGKIYNLHKFKKIYGIDTVLIDSISHLISFDSVKKIYRKDSIQQTNFSHKSYFKFEINGADTNLLKKLPLIGSGRAAMIVSYRDRLGGFHSPMQLLEIENIPDSVVQKLIPYISCSNDSIKKIAINQSNIKWLKRHPYINYYQAKAIYNLRWDKNHKGKLNKDDMYKIREFSKAELELLLPYLEF